MAYPAVASSQIVQGPSARGPMRSPELLDQITAKSAALVAPANVCSTQISCAA